MEKMVGRFEAMNLELDAGRSGRVQETPQPLDIG
jgi:hypothetical protein